MSKNSRDLLLSILAGLVFGQAIVIIIQNLN